MTRNYLIEIDDVDAGILVWEGASYAFHAVAAKYRTWEGVVFRSAFDAERALRRAAAPSRAATTKPRRPAVARPGEWADAMCSGGSPTERVAAFG